MSPSKRVYSRQQLLKIAEEVKDRRPTTAEEEVYNIIEDAAPRSIAPSAALTHTGPNRRGAKEGPIPTSNHHQREASHSASTSNGAVGANGASAGRFDKRWSAEGAAAAANASSLDRRNSSSSSARTGRGGVVGPSNSSSSSWRGGGKDRETFEEGYLYELEESKKHKQVLDEAVAQHEHDMKQHLHRMRVEAAKEASQSTDPSNATRGGGGEDGGKGGAQSSSSAPPSDDPSLTDELEAMFRKMRQTEMDEEAAATTTTTTTAATTTTAKSRFFFGGGGSGAQEPAKSEEHVIRRQEELDVTILPSPTATAPEQSIDPWAAWEKQQQEQRDARAKEAQQQKAAAEAPAVKTSTQQRGSSSKVWSALDLEQQLLQQKSAVPPPAPTQPQPQSQQQPPVSSPAAVNLRALQQVVTAAPSQPSGAVRAPMPQQPQLATGAKVIDAASLESALLTKITPVPAAPTSAPATPPQHPSTPPQQQTLVHAAQPQPQYVLSQPQPQYTTVQYGAMPQQWVTLPNGQQAIYGAPPQAYGATYAPHPMQMQPGARYMMVAQPHPQAVPMSAVQQVQQPGRGGMPQVVYLQQHPGGYYATAAPQQFAQQQRPMPPR